MKHLIDSFGDPHILCIVNKMGNIFQGCVYHTLMHNFECVQYFCKPFKAQKHCTALEIY